MDHANPFETDLDRNPANYAPLTPLGFIERAAYVYPGRTAVVHGARRYSWSETYARSRRLASALAGRGIGIGDTVAVMAANTPEMYECHFGVPMAGAVLNTLNTRLDADAIAFMLNHGNAQRADHRPRVFRDRGARAGAGGAPADRHRHRRPGVRRRRASAWARPTTRRCSPRATRNMRGSRPPTNGMRSRSITPPAPPAIPRAWCITIAAPI